MDEFFSAIGQKFACYEKLLQYKVPKLEIVYTLVSCGEETLVTENIPELESLVTAIGVLQKNYPDHVFTPAQVQRCNHIFRLIMIHCSYVEYDTPTQTAFGFEEAELYAPGHFPKTRKDVLADLKSTPEILVICYEVEQCGREFTLLELLTNEKAYEIFSNVWENRPNYNFNLEGR